VPLTFDIFNKDMTLSICQSILKKLKKTKAKKEQISPFTFI